ncbi:MAG TPA: S9 family peptidase [Gemmata sp.]|jgi:dipeptidyl aminopeptidase/acylaminoacyl peptidase|nr:S9 family peptidase [Gemmata sp.]
MRWSLTSFLFLAIIGSSFAAPPERTHDITPEDYASVNTITEVALSPNGKQVAYCLATWDKKDDNRRTELWVVDADGKGKPKQLTTDRANDHSPKWSADQKSVYAIATRKKGDAKKPPYDGKPQIWKVPVTGGEPVAVTAIEGGVTGFDYAPKANALFYSIETHTTDEDAFSALRKKYDKPEYSLGKRAVSELFRIDAGGKAEKVVAEKRYIREFSVTRDGKRIAMISAFDDTVVKSEGESRVDVWEDGKVVTPPTDVYRQNAASPYAWLESLAWSPDGKRFAFCAVFDGYPAELIVGEWENNRWSTHRMPRKEGIQVRGYGTPLRWITGDSLFGLSDLEGSVGLLSYNPHTREVIANTEAGSIIYAFDIAPVGGLPVVVRGTTQGFPELELGFGKDQRIVLTSLNPHTDTWKLPTIEHITWKAAEGTSVGGPLELPYGYKKGEKKLPLVVAIHGGPTTASYADIRFDPHNGRLYFAAKGYAVLCPNYRGSTGYGDKFVTQLIGNENDIEVKDILAGIQHLIKEGIADPDRVAVMGWSNGGYLTNCLITLKNTPVKIAAASSGAGILDTVAEWGFNDEPAYPIVFKKGLPWETPDIYRKTSPTYGIGNVKTPTLIHVGGGDVRCPPGHSRMLYRALSEYNKVPTELVVYPGEPHGLTKLNHRTAKMEWDLAWFEKYMKAK